MRCEFPIYLQIYLDLSHIQYLFLYLYFHTYFAFIYLLLCRGSGLSVVQRLLQVLRSQSAFVQHLFQREPEALKCQEDEPVQLEVRAKALQQQALEQEVASQRRIQVCSAHLLRAT